MSLLNRTLPRQSVFLFLGLLALLPIVVLSTANDSWLLVLILLLSGGLYFYHLKRTAKERSNPLSLSILVLLLMIAISLLTTFDVMFSLPRAINLVFGVLLFYAFLDVIRASRQLLYAGVLLQLGIGAAISAVALVGVNWPNKFSIVQPIVRRLPTLSTGLPGAELGFHANEVAGVLLWVTPLAVVICLATLQRQMTLQIGWIRLGLYGMTLLMVSVLVLTQSRGALLGLFLGLVVAFNLSGLFALPKWGVAFLLLLGASVLFGLAFIPAANTELSAVIFEEGRIEIWRRAIATIQDAPFTGVGLNSFRRTVHFSYPLSFVFGFSQVDFAHAHNQFLQVALDLGLPGLIAYGSIWLICPVLLVSVCISQETDELRVLAAGVLGCLVAYFVYGLTDTVALGAKPSFLFWLLLSLVIGIWQHSNMQVEAS